jgi:hypothetical protein
MVDLLFNFLTLHRQHQLGLVTDRLHVVDWQIGVLGLQLSQETFGSSEVGGLTVGPGSLLFDFKARQQESILMTEKYKQLN